MRKVLFLVIAILTTDCAFSQAGPIVTYQVKPSGSTAGVRHLWGAFCNNQECTSSQIKHLDSSNGDSVGNNASAILVGGNPIFTHTFLVGCHADQTGLKMTRCTDATCSGPKTNQILVNSPLAYPFHKTIIGADGNPIIFFLGPRVNTQPVTYKLGILKCGDSLCQNNNETRFLDLGLNLGFIDAALPPDGKPLILTTTNVNYTTNRLTTLKCTDTACTNVEQGLGLQAPNNYLYGEGSLTVDSGGRGRIYTNLKNSSEWTNIQHTLMYCTNLLCTSVVQKAVTNIYSAGLSIMSNGMNNLPLLFNLNYASSVNQFTFESRQCMGRRCENLTVGSSATGLSGINSWDTTRILGKPVFTFFNSANSALYIKSCTDSLCSGSTPNIMLDISTTEYAVFGTKAKILRH